MVRKMQEQVVTLRRRTQMLHSALLVLLCCPCISSTMVSRGSSVANDTQHVRRPSSVRPVHYTVKLQAFLHGNRSIHGEVQVELEVIKRTSAIILHLADILVRNDTIKVTAVNRRQNYPVRREVYDPRRQQYTVQLRWRLQPGKAYLLAMKFVASLANTPKGIYFTSYKDSEGNERTMAATHFWPTNARRAFPCFDDPAMKATYEVHIARESHMMALSNMPLVKTTPIQGQEGWLWDQFATSLNMSTYLVAFAIIQYTSRSATAASGTTVNVWAEAAVLDKTSLALEATAFSLTFFESYFNLPYPLQKLDLVALPDTPYDGMENWGLIFYRESEFQWEVETSTAGRRRQMCELVMHETAHQWFGNLVTFKWWTDLWLSEGFATYMATLAVHNFEPSWGMLEQFVVTRQQKVMQVDALFASHPITLPVKQPQDIEQVFFEIPYNKGAAVIRMMEHFLTLDTFKKAISNYLSARSQSNADQDDLWAFMTTAAHEDGSLPQEITVKTVMDTWTLQEGFPVITVYRYHNGSAKLTQERFVAGDAAASPVPASRWWVPVTFTSQKRPSFVHTRAQTWLSSHANHVTVTGLPPPQFWVIFNLQMTGFYRVNYDEYNWNLLAYQLAEDHSIIHVTNRAQIIDDALTLARAGFLSYDCGLNVTVYLKNERSYVAWKAAFNNMQFLHRMMRHTPAYGAFKDYMLSILEPVYESLGFEDGPEDDLQTLLLRSEVVRWACRLRLADCIDNSVRLFNKWMTDPENSTVAPNMAETVMCSAVQEGGQAAWEYTWQQLHHASTSPDLRDAMRRALGCSSQVWLLARYLEAAWGGESGLRWREFSEVLEAVASSDAGSFLAWHYLLENWSRVTQFVGGDSSSLASMVEAATRHFNTAYQLQQLLQVMTEGRAGSRAGRLERAQRLVLENVRNNISWKKRSFSTIVEWLSQRGFSPTLHQARKRRRLTLVK
ncbi:aminopeptidase N [Procambarus clarkii]|uniref:aminopeptidase N n=1 Tax=Procambarus clarkii TaxID=6728 RepID=UPI001E67462E|nr:aminopeptidase N-like [Procambarus clarkii]